MSRTVLWGRLCYWLALICLGGSVVLLGNGQVAFAAAGAYLACICYSVPARQFMREHPLP